VHRRFHHFTPVTGPGSVRRGIVQRAKTLICKAGTTAKVKIRSSWRVASDGLRGLLWGSKRPCFCKGCACTGANGPHSLSHS